MTATTILNRYKQAVTDMMVAQDKSWRLKWWDYQDGIFITELPVKGKKKLRQGKLPDLSYLTGEDMFIPQNLLRAAKVSPSMSFDDVVKSLNEAMKDAAQEYIKQVPEDKRSNVKYLLDSKFSLSEVHYLMVEPLDHEPMVVAGKDFKVTVTWVEFKAYSPKSDLQNHDPSYTRIVSKSAQSARKLYQILLASPKALENVTWDKFDEFLKSHKINYEYQFSSW